MAKDIKDLKSLGEEVDDKQVDIMTKSGQDAEAEIAKIDQDPEAWADEKLEAMNKLLNRIGVRIEKIPGKESAGQFLARKIQEIEANKIEFAQKEKTRLISLSTKIDTEISKIETRRG